jgi:hypothetical protein
LVSTEHHPIQGFFWGDFTTRYGHEYTYRVVAMRGEPGALHASETVEVRIATEKEDEGQHAVYFNRGFAGLAGLCQKISAIAAHRTSPIVAGVPVAVARSLSSHARFHPQSQRP